MQTKTSLVIAFALIFTFTVFPSVSRAQQENDDPNWRERELQRRLEETKKLQKEVERLNQRLDEATKKSREMEMKLERLDRPSFFPKSRFLDIYDYGPTYRNPALTYREKQLFCPSPKPSSKS
jgi:hypothetical protein